MITNGKNTIHIKSIKHIVILFSLFLDTHTDETEMFLFLFKKNNAKMWSFADERL